MITFIMFRISILYMSIMSNINSSSKHFSIPLNISHHGYRSNHIFQKNKQKRFSKSEVVTSTNFIDIIKNGNLYNFDYYNCSQYPESKNVSKSSSSSSLLMIKSKFTRNYMKKKEVSFDVTTEVILLENDFPITSADIANLVSEESMIMKANNTSSSSAHHYIEQEEIVLDSKLLSDSIDVAFVFYDDKSGNEMIDIINSWSEVVKDYNIIFVSNKLADIKNNIEIPKWIQSYEVYSALDIEKIIHPFKADLRSYAFLISKKKYLFLIVGEKQCPYSSVNKSNTKGIIPSLMFNMMVNTVRYEHNSNEKLNTIAVIPIFSNILSVENKIKINSLDYPIDNDKNIAVVLPNKVRFDIPLNQPIMFNRERINPFLLYFSLPPIETNRTTKIICNKNMSITCEDVVSGWILQVVTEVLPLNIKVGFPFPIDRKYNKNNNVWTVYDYFDYDSCISDMKKENNFLPEWYCDGKMFFTNFKYSRCPRFFNNRFITRKYCSYSRYGEIPNLCLFIELFDAIKTTLGHYPYFSQISDHMFQWAVMDRSIYELRMDFLSIHFPISSRNSLVSNSNRKLKCAIITISHNENVLLSRWVSYHLKHFHPKDIFILDHLTNDDSIIKIKIKYPEINFVKLEGNQYHMPLGYRNAVVENYQDVLLRYGYKSVIFTDVDELIVPNPVRYPKGLSQYIDHFIKSNDSVVRVNAYELAHIAYGNGSKGSEEPPLNWNESILRQRSYYIPDKLYCKALLTKIPLRYRPGFHKIYDHYLWKTIPVDNDLVMFHLKSLDYQFCHERAILKHNMSQDMILQERQQGFADHWEQYDNLKKYGELCRFANGCFIGDKNSKHYDNTGTIELRKLEDYWKQLYL